MFHRKKEVLFLSVNIDKCIGCESCVAACKRRILDMKYGADFKYHAWVKYSVDCVGCGKCQKACMTGAINLVIN